MVRTLEELLTDVRAVVADETSDDVLTLLENVTDTVNAAESRETIEGLRQQIADLDESWRRKFRDRFFNTASADPVPEVAEEETEEKITRYEDLFS